MTLLKKIFALLLLTGVSLLAAALFYPLTVRILAIPAGGDITHRWELEPEPLRQFITPSPDSLSRLGLFFAPYEGEPDGKISLVLKDAGARTLYHHTFPARQAREGDFTYFDGLNLSGLQGQTLTLEVSSSLPSPQARVALLYHPDAGQFPGSYLMRGNILYEGVLAMEWYRRQSLVSRLLKF